VNTIERIISFWSRVYYIQPAVTLFGLTALAFGLIMVGRSRLGKIFLAYLLLEVLVLILDQVFYARQYSNPAVINIANCILCIVEYLVYSYYYNHKLNWKFRKKYCYSTLALILITAIIYFSGGEDQLVLHLLRLAELTFLLPLIFVYYLELFTEDTSDDIFSRPSFWITTGMLFLTVLSIQFDVVKHNFFPEGRGYFQTFTASLYYLPFIINLIFLTKAFSCRKPLII
jgi:hypothetical protein